jgi:hypothetical protein
MPKLTYSNAKLVETLSAAAHDGWMVSKRLKGITSQKSESGEELMVPYDALSEEAKDLDRNVVRAGLEAIERTGHKVVQETEADTNGG